MLDPKIYLEKDFAYHADMLDALLDEETKVLYSEEDGVMLRIGKRGPFAISAKTAEAMTKMASLIEKERYMAVIRPLKFLPEFFAVKETPKQCPVTRRHIPVRNRFRNMKFRELK